MATQRWNIPMALVAVCTCFLSLFSQASAQILCSDINTSSMSSPNFTQFQSWGSCTQYCTAFWDNIQPKIYSWAILQDHQCWCSDYSPTGDNSTTGCTDPCPGYGQNTCGSADGNFFSYVSSGRVPPAGTAGAGGAGDAASTTATLVTVTATPSFSSFSSSSSSSAGILLSASGESSKSSTSGSPTPSLIISTFTTIGQVHTVTTTPTSPANSQNGLIPKSGSSGLGTGGAVGLTIGLVALIAIVSALIWFCLKRKREQEAEEYSNMSRRGSSAGIGGPIPSRTMSENSRYVLGTDGRQVVETWEPGDAPGSRRSRLMPVDPRLDPFAPVYQRNGENKSRESVNTIRDDHDYSRRVVHQGPILRATNPDHDED